MLGGPEVSHLPKDAEIFKYAGYVIRGEGEIAFRLLCEDILNNNNYNNSINLISQVNLNEIKPAYHLYTDEDISKKLIYVESGRGCPFNCEFCLSSVKPDKKNAVREFDLDQFLAQMDMLIKRGARTIKFLDRTFNFNIPRALKIIDFFLEKTAALSSFTVHFEMVPSLFPPQLISALACFPPGTLRLETGIQTLNAEVSSLVKLPGNGHPENDLETLSLLRRNTNAVIHADLIAGLPGENIESFGEGFDRLWQALYCQPAHKERNSRAEIQPGILKLLPGTRISRHIEKHKMRFNSAPPYEIEETSSVCADDLSRIKNFARFWELIFNRGMIPEEKMVKISEKSSIFWKFMELSDSLFSYFGRNWGIDKNELSVKLNDYKFIL